MASKKPLIVYHGRCLDGFTGAWAAWKKFGSRADYIALEHAKNPEKLPSDRPIYFVDFCFPESVMEELVSRNPLVTVLDHHISCKDVATLAQTHRFALDRSGCSLAWSFFHPGKKIPHLVRVIEDNDLYLFKVAHTREFIAIFAGLEFDFKLWNKLERDLENSASRKLYVKKGKDLLEYKQQLIKRMLAGAEKVVFEGYKTYALNATLFHSDAANAIITTHKTAIGITWLYVGGKIKVSLRSNGKVDVAKLAQKYGGGGHKAAAGFLVPLEMGFPWKSIH
ncbi:MAG: DHHA1 domain-containing protein [bacterium]|nr:DHHA1 domain-containing protein [bacterium]